MSKWWNAQFLQICFDEETNSFTCSIFIINICEYKPKLININHCTYSDDLNWTAGFICVTYLCIYELLEAWQFLLRGRVWTKTMRQFFKWLHLCSYVIIIFRFWMTWMWVNGEIFHNPSEHSYMCKLLDFSIVSRVNCWNQRWFHTHCGSLDLCFSDSLLWFQPIYWIQALNFLPSEGQLRQTLHSELWLLSGGYWFLALFIRNTFTFEFT